MKMNMNDIEQRLRDSAERQAENRRIAEFGPGGGNPEAKAEDHIEWEAAEYINKLRLENTELKNKINLSEWDETLFDQLKETHRLYYAGHITSGRDLCDAQKPIFDKLENYISRLTTELRPYKGWGAYLENVSEVLKNQRLEEFISKQKQLDPDCTKVLYDNLPDLYEYDGESWNRLGCKHNENGVCVRCGEKYRRK